MDEILDEIEKIQGERQADERIKKVLRDLADVVNNIMINMSFPSEDCVCEPEGKPLVEVLNEYPDPDYVKAITGPTDTVIEGTKDAPIKEDTESDS